MSEEGNEDVCYFCKRGAFIRRSEELAFHQWTDKGYVYCRVKGVVGVCDRCGSRHWNEEVEKLIELAVQFEYDKLP
jgi:hypothetical protein